jgi:hypothetical protein
MMSQVAGMTPVVNYQQFRFYMPFNYQYNDLASDKYYTAFNLEPTCLYMATQNIGIEGGMQVTRNYYWIPSTVEEDNRNGRHYGGILGGYYFFDNYQGFLQARFSYGYDNTVGTNWIGSGYRILLAGQKTVFDRLQVGSYVLLGWTPYSKNWSNGTGTPYPARNDFNFQFRIDLTYKIYKGLEANFHYYFENNNSNINLYWYSKSMLGCFLGYKY